jgi:hypothetical protein
MAGKLTHLRRTVGTGLADSTACGIVPLSFGDGVRCTVFEWSVTCEACVAAMTERELVSRASKLVAVEVDVERTVDDAEVMRHAVPRLLGEVVVETGGRRRILFDGVQLPWFVAEGGLSIVPEIGGVSRVVVEFLVERARVVDEFEDDPS